MEEIKPKFGIGDKVKIVKYGSLIWRTKESNEITKNIVFEDDTFNYIDMQPDLVGKEAIVTKAEVTQGRAKYSLKGVNKVAWYDEQQLEMISRNPNND